MARAMHWKRASQARPGVPGLEGAPMRPAGFDSPACDPILSVSSEAEMTSQNDAHFDGGCTCGAVRSRMTSGPMIVEPEVILTPA